jgi:hypothetical protein
MAQQRHFEEAGASQTSVRIRRRAVGTSATLAYPAATYPQEGSLLKKVLLSKKVHCGRFMAWTDGDYSDMLHLGIVGADAKFVPCDPCLEAIKEACKGMGFPYTVISEAITAEQPSGFFNRKRAK